MCPSDIDDCRSGACYPGVACTDLPAPRRGFKCADCPNGMTGNGRECFKNRETKIQDLIMGDYF